MATLNMPALDQVAMSTWSTQDINAYNKLPYYFAQMSCRRWKEWSRFRKLLGKKKWTPNMGDTMRMVTKEYSPIARQFIFPSRINQPSKKDVHDVKERISDAVLYKHRFESPNIPFVGSFQDFLKDHVSFAMDNLMRQITMADEQFLRGYVFHGTPFAWFAGAANGELKTNAPGYPDSATISNGTMTIAGGVGKTSNWLATQISQITTPSNLTLNTVALCANQMETGLRMPPFEGSEQYTKNNAGLQGRYMLMCSAEAYNQFTFDPFYLKYKTQLTDVIKDGFAGPLFGRVATMIEDLPLRMKADGTFPMPEVRVVDPNSYNYGESIPNPDYVNAPYEVAWLISGAFGFAALEAGPPPKDFSSTGMADGFGKMWWNGEVIATKNFLVEGLDENGNAIRDTNSYGELLRLQSQMTFGCAAEQRRSIIPIVFARKYGSNE